MPLGTSLVPDLTPNVANGSVGNLTAAQLTSAYGSGNVKTASKDLTFHFRGQVIHFPKNVPVVVTADLAAALTAANAPVS